MEKRKRWQLILILTVILLTLYNILPTVLFYTKPLSQPIDKKQAFEVAKSAATRVNQLEKQSLEWLKSYTKLLGIKAKSITLDPISPKLIHLEFSKDQEAQIFKKHLPRAGSLIPFLPNQLSLIREENRSSSKKVTLQRNVPIHFDLSQLDKEFQYIQKKDSNGAITPEYRNIINQRLIQLALSVGGKTENANYVETILSHSGNPRLEEFLLILSQNILSYTQIFGEDSFISKRYFATFTQSEVPNRAENISRLIQIFESQIEKIKLERIQIEEKEKTERISDQFLDSQDQEKLSLLKSKENRLVQAYVILKRHFASFKSGMLPYNFASLKTIIQKASSFKEGDKNRLTLETQEKSPLIQKMTIDLNSEKIFITLNSAIQSMRQKLQKDPSKTTQLDQLNQLIYGEIARIGRDSGENLIPYQDEFEIELNHLPNSQSLLVLDIGSIAKKEAKQIKQLITTHWKPTHPDLKEDVFPIWDEKTYNALPSHQKKLGLLIYVPISHTNDLKPGFRTNSIYVIAKGIQNISNRLQANPSSSQAKAFVSDFDQLRHILQNNGFYGYPGTTYPLSASFSNDFIFEAEDFYKPLLMATREEFQTYGTHRFATLEFTDLKQRIYALNQIDTQIHEDLLKWRDEYQASQIGMRPETKLDIPKPTTSPLLSNLLLSFKKYFRGDDRKILKWGLDLSGGKTVQLELRDHKGHSVTNEADMKQGIDELYRRINKMGVSEVTIRQEGNHITLDFPSAQGLSARDLVKASSMFFHLVNEKFTPQNKQLRGTITQFLQDIWNEAVVTNRRDIQSINAIAWKHLYGDALTADTPQPISEAAKALYNQGLRLEDPLHANPSNHFNDTLSKIAIYRGDRFSDWHGQTHPLLIVMNNYALEGSNLTNVHASYDPSQGNYLSFQVKGSQTLSSGEKINPRTVFYNWTSTFSKDKIASSPLSAYTGGQGYRMAVILNGFIVNAPAIESGLRNHVSITGSFTQREANRLEADLKAGSLSFTPFILSEKNVSPDLGLKDRTMGILATIVALIFVIALMIGYYRFAGLIASVAVLFNLLIMWATLQNIQATITLAKIAGIILTVGMAVDANVLVFERIREEFALSKRLAFSIQTGYRKAFSAIFDSNLTTIIAAIILLNFDSGPIKGFALTLIIGIVSSMFTALFMTRYFFAGWVQNPKHKILKMARLIKTSSFDFLKYRKVSFAMTLIVILVGAYLFVDKRHTMLGMDFTGGYSLTLELNPQMAQNYRVAVEKALTKAGLSSNDFQVRELSPSNQINILLSRKLDQNGYSFEGLPLETNAKTFSYHYENNPRILFIVNALETAGLHLTPTSLKQLDSNWTSISGQMSNSMRNNAFIGLAIALISILIYITIRFEFKYAISATLGLAVDVLFTLALVTIFHTFKAPVQIDLNTIAALMTIIGYSLNDTIIIFDRIREDLKLMRKHSFKEIINHALNTTLSRTIMTSGTTLVVLLALLFLGGITIFGLSLVMVIGVVFGTFSSLFITTPLLLAFHKKELKKEKNFALKEN